MSLFGLGKLIKGVGQIADDLHTSDEERMKMAQQERMIDAELMKGQMEINKVEAAHGSRFVAGWRPFIGWVGGIALAYQFILYPILNWIWIMAQAKGHLSADLSPPPVFDSSELMTLVLGMLGIGTMRSFDKFKKVQTDKIK